MSGHTDEYPDGRARSGSEGQYSQRQRDQSQDQGHYDTGQGYGQRYHGSKAWWSVGEFLHQGITHQSVGLSLGHNEEETWELSDSLADLYQAVTQRQKRTPASPKGHNRSESNGGGARGESENQVDILRWLDEDTSHGFIRVFASDADTHARLFPCTLSTSAQKICLQLGIPGNSLHVQLSGDVIRRMESFDCPLAIQNEYLSGLGYTDIKYIQQEGPKEDLAYLVRFYAGKPLSDSTYSRNQLSTYAYVRKGKLIHQWVRRLCVISGTRLQIYREKGAEPTVVQLAKGMVEEVQIKGQSLVLKLTSTIQGERSLYISFLSQEDYNRWLKKMRKATAKLPSKADLSNCNLEFLPETVFINTELQILILRHNALRERPIEEDIYTIGWLDDLPRFTALRSLNLADNQLTSFPLSLCSIQSLMELNLASNKLEEIPSQISELVNLQVLHLHNNQLSSLPEEIGQMKNLAVIVLAFNKFTHIPSVLLQSRQASFMIDSIIMAGNRISRLPADLLLYMTHIKKIDLRLNKLQLLPTETAKFQSLEHITHVDIRENQVTDLDIRAIKCMEYLNCERNNMRSMQLNGASLKNIYASHNLIQTLSVSPKPEWLVTMDVSYNKLTELPNWLPDCFFLVHLDVSHNHLRALPDRLFTDAKKLKTVRANHNRLSALPDKIRSDTLEELHLQNNFIRHLTVDLFIKAHRLRYLNMTRNKLCDLPPPNKNDSYNKLQELYLSFNHLANQALHKICCFPRLRVLHIARNKVSAIQETDIEKLEQLTELNVSSNNLTYLPAALGRHPKLQVLRANCNLLQELPNFKNSSGLKVLEVSSNHLVNVNMSNLMASQVSLLDISANPNILVKSHDIEAAKNSKRLCMLDMRGQNWSLEDIRSQGVIDDGQLWQTGLSQTSGIRNKLSVTAINKPHFNDKGEALFAIFDGGRNDSIANVLCEIVPAKLREERARSKKPEVYLRYAILSAHRNLKSQGQKLGATAVIAHLHKDDKGQHILSVANVGDAQVVLCRHRKAYLLSRPYIVAEDTEDTNRVIKSGGIITEDGRVAGVTYNTRLLGCSYLYPHIIPEPHLSSTALTTDDTFFIVASQGLWKYITYEEAIKEIRDTPDPVVAAKRLQDLAQGYGSRENIAVLVVRLMLSQDERHRIKDLMRVQRTGQRELLKVLSQQGDIMQLRDGIPKVEELNDVVIDKFGHAKKNRSNRKQLPDAASLKKSLSSDVSEESSSVSRLSSFDGSVTVHSDRSGSGRISHKRLKEQRSNGSDRDNTGTLDEKRLYKKKSKASSSSSSHASWETMLKKRLSEEIKAKELKQSLEAEDGSSDDDDDDSSMTPSEKANWIALKQKRKAERPEEWEEQLQQRLTQELVNRELRKALEKDNVRQEDFEKDMDSEMSDTVNWDTKVSKKSAAGYSSDGILSRDFASRHTEMVEIKNNDDILLASAESTDTIQSETIRLMANSTHSHFDADTVKKDEINDQYDDSFERMSPSGSFNVSPSESVSSIDTRLHNEADEIYRLRYFNSNTQSQGNEERTHFHGSNVSQSGFSGTGEIEQNEVYTRPLSPDSLISQDEFVKPPISNANIDRDALLFHQMQMARAQAHAGSSASLDSIQSAPMHASRRDIFPSVGSSSHSIEVLVNIGEDKPSKKMSDSMQGGRVKWGSSMSGDVSGNRTVTNSRVSINESEQVNQDRGSRKIRSSEKLEKKQRFERRESGGAFVINDSGETEDEDRDTLVGDADDIGQIEDFSEDINHSSVCADTGVSLKNMQDAVALDVSQKGIKQGGDIDDDSDSDDSIGNVSLEDGYTAVEFPWLDRQGSLSMLNVMESESEDYPELFMSKGNSVKIVKPKLSSQSDLRMKRSKESLSKHVSKPTPAPRMKPDNQGNDDYEIIDDDSNVDNTAAKIKDIDDTDDLNPYEDVQYSPSLKKSQPKKEVRKVPAEEDIDALYAKVNKIKMNKIFEKPNTAVAENSLDKIFPAFHEQISAQEVDMVQKFPQDVSYNEIESVMILSTEEDEDDDEENTEKEIFISATDIVPKPTVELASTHSKIPSPKLGHRNEMQSQDKKPSVPPVMFKRTPPDAFGISSSSSSSPSSSVKSSPTPIPKCNISVVDSSDTANFTAMTNSKSGGVDLPSPMSFKSASASPPNPRYRAPLPPDSGPPPLPPKMPYPKEEAQESSQRSRSWSKPVVPPKNKQSQKLSRAPVYPVTRFTPVAPTSHSPLQQNTSYDKTDQNDNLDDSVLSAHELYPESHQPSSSYFPSSVDVSSPASKLSTQRSIIITYL